MHDLGKGFATSFFRPSNVPPPLRRCGNRAALLPAALSVGEGLCVTLGILAICCPSRHRPASCDTRCRALAHTDGCKKIVVSFTVVRTVDGLVDSLHPSTSPSSEAPLRLAVWRDARLLTTKNEVGGGKHLDYIAALYGLLLGLAACCCC